MARERRLGRKREGGWWILNSAGESFQRGKMRLPRAPASKKGDERDGVDQSGGLTLFYIIGNRIFLGFGLLVKLNMQFDGITFGSFSPFCHIL